MPIPKTQHRPILCEIAAAGLPQVVKTRFQPTNTQTENSKEQRMEDKQSDKLLYHRRVGRG